MRRLLRRFVELERRWGVPANAFAVKLYEWFFVIVGPTVVIVSAVWLASGLWIGAATIIVGVWMTGLGWVRLIRFVRRLRGDS